MAVNELITIENFPASNINEISNLTADALAAQKVIAIENPDSFIHNQYCLLGDLGKETTEVKKIDTATGKSITFTENLVSNHYRNEPIRSIRANQVKIYKAPNVDGTVPSDATFVLLTTITLQGDQLNTTYVDTDGGDGYWYKYTFYNDVSLEETPLGNVEATRGGNYGHYVTVDEVRQEAGLTNNRYIADELIFTKLIESESEVNASLVIGGYDLPLTEVPQDVKNATKLLAAGYILTIDYGPEFAGTNKDGEKKIKMARDILSGIETGDKPLVSSAGVDMSAANSGVSGYPDDSAPDPMFTTEDRY